jgi:hypothetical protein
MPAVPGSAVSAYNNEPGTGRTGYWEIPPNNYDFYTEEEKYKPVVQADGGILSSASPHPHPSPSLDPAFPSSLHARGELANGGQTPSVSPIHTCGCTGSLARLATWRVCTGRHIEGEKRWCWGVRRPRTRRGDAW